MIKILTEFRDGTTKYLEGTPRGLRSKDGARPVSFRVNLEALMDVYVVRGLMYSLFPTVKFEEAVTIVKFR